MVSYGSADIYVIDHETGQTKAVVDEFYSLRWTEKFNECGDFELSGPEEPEPGRRASWVDNTAEGDYIQFTYSSTGHGGRYTMVVESFYTEWDADNGYTVYANGRSLDCLLERRINLGWAVQPLGCSPYDEYKWMAAPYGTRPTDTNHYPTWPHQIHPTADLDEDYNDPRDDNIVQPFAVERIDRESSVQGCDIFDTCYRLVEWNAGDLAKDSRKFDASTAHTFNLYYDRSWDKNLYHSPDLIDGRYEDVYSLVTKLIAYTADKLEALGLRVNGEMRQVVAGQPETRFYMTFELYPARDRTISNEDGNDPVIFSRDMDNAITLNYVHGMANMKNSVFFDTGLRYTPSDVYEVMNLLQSIEYEESAIDFEKSPLETDTSQMDEDQLKSWEERRQKWEELKSDMDAHIALLENEIKLRDQELASANARIAQIDEELKTEGLSKWRTEALNNERGVLIRIRDGMPDRKKEDQERLDSLRRHRSAIDNRNERSDEEKEKLDDEKESLDDLKEKLDERKEDMTDEDSKLGHEEVYHATLSRNSANPEWDKKGNVYYGSWTLPDAGPVGIDRREFYMQDEALPFMNELWANRFNDYDIEDHTIPDWDTYCEMITRKERKEIVKKENSAEDDMEATVNYNVMYMPPFDYDLGDVVTVMGIHTNESVRKMRVDEMTYSIDSGGFTVVPAFVMLDKDK